MKLSRQAVEDVNANRRLVAVSDATRDFHVGQGLAGEKCVVSHNGVDLDEFRPRPPTGYLHRELRLNDRTQLVATIGQLGLRKGLDVVLRAAAQVARKAARCPLAHSSASERRTRPSRATSSGSCEAASHVPPLRDRVHFLGSRTDVPQLLNECALLVHARPAGAAGPRAAGSGGQRPGGRGDRRRRHARDISHGTGRGDARSARR